MNEEDLIKEITKEMIPEAYHSIADAIGIKNLMLLSKAFGGSMIYIPKFDSLTKSIRDVKIKKEFNGTNYRDLALKYNLCESTIRNIVDSRILENQVSMFDVNSEKKE